MKNISILLPASENDDSVSIKDVAISPGTTPKDVLREAKLNNYTLRQDGGGFVPQNKDLYASVQDGQKFQAFPKMEVA